jgi:hypothetical protein
MPEIVVQRVLQEGIKNLRNNDDAFDEIFNMFLCPELVNAYGQAHIDTIKKWFKETKIPVVQAWSLNPQRIPCFSIHLASEMEDEQKAAIGDDPIGDFIGEDAEENQATGVFTVYVDIGIHADRSSDSVLWLYYIMSYILFKEKRRAERLGLKLHTWSASDYNKDASKMADNIWTRWVRFKCTTQNYLGDEPRTEADELNLDLDGQPATSDDDDDITDISD